MNATFSRLRSFLEGCVRFGSISMKYRLTERNIQVLSFHSLLTSITEALRAGGLLLLIDFDPVSYTAPGVAYTPPLSSSGTSMSLPAAVKLLKAVNYACTSRGADILSVQHFKACNNINRQCDSNLTAALQVGFPAPPRPFRERGANRILAASDSRGRYVQVAPLVL